MIHKTDDFTQFEHALAAYCKEVNEIRNHWLAVASLRKFEPRFREEGFAEGWWPDELSQQLDLNRTICRDGALTWLHQHEADLPDYLQPLVDNVVRCAQELPTAGRIIGDIADITKALRKFRKLAEFGSLEDALSHTEAIDELLRDVGVTCGPEARQVMHAASAAAANHMTITPELYEDTREALYRSAEQAAEVGGSADDEGGPPNNPKLPFDLILDPEHQSVRRQGDKYQHVTPNLIKNTDAWTLLNHLCGRPDGTSNLQLLKQLLPHGEDQRKNARKYLLPAINPFDLTISQWALQESEVYAQKE